MIGLVLVSHSAALADGLAAVVAQMAPEVVVAAAGGDDEGGIGTSFDRIMAAVDEADAGQGAVILYDLGSAKLTSEMVLEMFEPERVDRLRIVDAPLVEGALAASTVITEGVDIATVVAAAEGAGGTTDERAATDRSEAGSGEGAVVEEVEVRNPLGLHARPAGAVTRSLRDLEATVQIRTAAAAADARSMLGLVGLGTTAGDQLTVEADGPDARQAVDRVVELIEEGFGEADEQAAGGDGSRQLSGDADVTSPKSTGPSVTQSGSQVSGAEAGAVLEGRSAARGGATGPAAHAQPFEPELPTAPPDDVDTERQRLREAVSRARRLQSEAAGSPAEGVFAAHEQLLSDPALTTAAEEAVDTATNAAVAWWEAVSRQRDVLRDSGTEFLAARAVDVVDVGLRVLGELGVDLDEPLPPPGAVVLADDVTPSRLTRLYDARVAAVVTSGGSPTSHAAIIARSLDLPMVVGVGPQLGDVADGTMLLVDADAGTLTVEPDPEVADRFRDRLLVAAEERERLRAAAHDPVVLSDGRRLRIGANVATAADARAAVANGAEEVGLLRTEFLFVDRADVPDEDEQAAALIEILEVLDGRSAVVRTMDVGGDKRAPALGLDPVRNGFLGRRGLRWSLTRPDIFIPHLRAILRAAAEHTVRIMFPFVTTVEEVVAARAAVTEAAGQLEADGRAFGRPQQIGIMVEIPGAAIRAAELAESVDFFSIGSNDLVQYLTAADRTLAEVADLATADNAGLLDVVRGVADAARAAGIWTGVCGEVAADPVIAAQLVDAGVDELSMSPAAIPTVKDRLRDREG